MSNSGVTLRVSLSPLLLRTLADITAAAASLPKLAERVLDLVEGGGGIVAASAFDGNGRSAAGAPMAGVFLEPTDALLDLAAAARADTARRTLQS